MNMRQLKHYHNLRDRQQRLARHFPSIYGVDIAVPVEKLTTLPVLNLSPAPKKETMYRVARVKDNEVVLETMHLEVANELIEKHVRQKKAKLYLV